MSGDWRKRQAERARLAEAGAERALAAISKVEGLLGTAPNQEEANRRLAEISRHAHLISPARTCGRLREGTGVSFSIVLIDHTARPDGTFAEVYPQNGMLAILKPGLLRIAMGAGVRPDPALCRRTDSGGDPRYYSFQAVGYLTQFDGNVVPLTAHKEYDLRPDSPMVLAMTAECTAKAIEDWEKSQASGEPPKDRKLAGCKTRDRAEEVGLDHAEARVRSMQQHAMAQCDSKAMLRMIRTLGVRQAYTPAELDLPFVTARLEYTGRFSDPEMQREADRRTMDQFTGRRAGLYGTPHGAPHTIDVPRSAVRVSPTPEPDEPDPPPPPRDAGGPADDAPPDAAEEPSEGANAQPATSGEAPQAVPGWSDEENAAAAAAIERPKGELPESPDAPPMAWKGKPFTISGGKGMPQVQVATCDDGRQLAYWRDRIEKELDEGVEAKFEAYTAAKLEAIEHRLSRLPPW